MAKYQITKMKKIILSALLLATFIVLDRLLTINTQFLAINLSLLPIMIAGMILGWKYALLIGGLGDLIGAIFWPFGSYFPGFTVSSALTGLIFGLFLYKNPNKEKRQFILKAILSNLIILFLINLFLNSLWLKIMYGKAFMYYLGTRIITQIVLFPIYTGAIILLEKSLKDKIKKYLYEEIEDK